MNLQEQVSRIKKIIYELSPQSEGVVEFLQTIESFPELLKHLSFPTFQHLRDYVNDASYDEFHELKKEVEYFFKRRKKYFKDEMHEIKRTVQDLSRNEGLDLTVDEVLDAFIRAKEVSIPKDVWEKLENTESNTYKKGEIKKVVDMANKYDKTNPLELKKILKSGDYRRPMILKFGDRYHLVSGNTRLSTAAAMGIVPRVLIAEV
jgi:ElaB/YqjD/DUF883 family membrane-anchored ribosome-binding protein